MDKARLAQLLDDFYLISGMEISLSDAAFHGILTKRCPLGNLCSHFHRSKKGVELCRASDAERMAEVKSTGRPLRYTCPIGITEALLPIVKNDRTVAYIFSAMGINRDEKSDSEILETIRSVAPTLSPEESASQLARMKHMSGEETEAYYRMLLLLARHIENEDFLLPDGESIGTLAKQYIKQNLSGKLTLTDISLHLHCSTVTLTQHFKEEFGMTVMEYVLKKRMELAERFLFDTDEPLRSVAEAVGFSDVEYFSRTFKRTHGLPPATWRNVNRDLS